METKFYFYVITLRGQTVGGNIAQRIGLSEEEEKRKGLHDLSLCFTKRVTT